MSEPTRKLAAIVFTDIVGFTKLTADDQSKASSLLKQQRELLRPIVESFNGSWIKEIGDGLLLIFDTVTDAVNCSIKIQEETKSIDDLDLRIGIHQGEILLEENDVIGDDVNIASRIEPFSASGGIAISNKVNDALIREKEFETKYLGKPKLKGVGQKVEVFCITSHGLPETKVSKVSAKLEPEGIQWNVFSLTGAVLTVIGVLFWINVSFLGIGIAKESEVPSIAILPLDNKGASDDEFYAYGISSDLISDVASAGLIRVASLNRIEDLGDISAEEKAEKLDVRYIAEGTLWKRDSIFQLSMELYDTKTEMVVWSERWQKNWSEFPAIRDLLAEKILENLKVEQRTDAPTYAQNPEAYEYYLKAKYKYEKDTNNDEDTEIARGLLNKAIELDENLIAAKILLGSTFVSERDYERAKDIYNSALKRAEELGDKMWMGRSIRRMGNIYYYTGNKNKALENFEASLVIAEELNDKWGTASCINNIGILSKINGDSVKSLESLKLALTIYTELDDKGSVGQTLNNIAILYKEKGDLDKALEHYELSLENFEDIDDQKSISAVLSSIGSVFKEYGDLHKSIDYMKRVVAIQEKLGNKEFMYGALQYIGWAYFTMGIYDKSLETYGMMLPIAKELQDKELMALIYQNISVNQFYNENYIKALEALEMTAQLQLEIVNVVDVPTIIYHLLTKKILGKEYSTKEIITLIKDEKNVRNYYIDYFGLYQLLEDRAYLEKAQNDIQKKADAMEDKFKEKYLNYPIQKQIIDEWERLS